MDRLRSRKAAVSQKIDQQRAATRFEPEPDQPVDVSVLDTQTKPRDAGAAKPKDTMTPAKPEEEDFAARLMKAKKKALKDREKRE